MYITLYSIYHSLFAAFEPCNRVVILTVSDGLGKRVDPKNQESLRINYVTALYNIALIECSNKISIYK